MAPALLQTWMAILFCDLERQYGNYYYGNLFAVPDPSKAYDHVKLACIPLNNTTIKRAWVYKNIYIVKHLTMYPMTLQPVLEGCILPSVHTEGENIQYFLEHLVA